MPDFSEELEYTDKILYLNDLDGVSQVALMKELAQAAKELYKEYPEFCALIPLVVVQNDYRADGSLISIYFSSWENQFHDTYSTTIILENQII